MSIMIRRDRRGVLWGVLVGNDEHVAYIKVGGRMGVVVMVLVCMFVKSRYTSVGAGEYRGV